MSSSLKAHLSLFLASLIYGANYTIAKGVMPQYIGPFGFIVLRVGVSLILFWLVSLLFNEKTDKKDIPLFMLCGVFGVAVNQLLFFKGLSITTPINAAIMMVTTPILVLLAANFLLKEKITFIRALGVFAGMAGAVVLLLIRSDFSFGSETLPGDVCILINAASWGFYLVIVTPLMKKYNTINVVKWTFLFGFIIVLPFGFSEFNEINWTGMPKNIILSTVFVVIGTTFFAYLLNNYALKALSPEVVSMYIYLQPVLATLIAVFLQEDQLNSIKIVAGLLIFAGVYLVNQSKNKKI